ncbi:TonB-dependent receptor plug domain-containing protein [Sporomusa sphaeroides]|uniref:Vitamin B12 transporter BtuB n=1 Tax=Sporomusa sphaeroides DSM 2875 TaxID=1337886 RepID=A0ABM9VZQ0_9FIRM|nr:TonB-dependent receptor [Sporomusa sphaeroides]OLS57175.1 vitamin B12 transporter BtuB precursor [Sporomusa sphaeroides DSM 2875]CVK18361.1 Vitamin B12 transporter BtuB precursor [Sporomusa sphaeroides DSM 2875]
MTRKSGTGTSKSWLCAMVTSALLLQMPAAVLAEETDNQETFSLDAMVITANRVPTEAAKTAANVTVVSQEQIENGPYANLGDVLRDINGVAVTTKGFAGAGQTVYLNGDDRVLVMIDGRRLSRPQGTASGGRASIELNSIVSLDNIERIEIVKGGASALYGSDAVGGVINIITRKGTEAKTTVDFSAGSWGIRNYGLSTQGSENGFSWYITANKKEQDYAEYNVLNPALTAGSSKGDNRRWPNSRYEGEGFTMRLDKTIDDNRSLTFNFEHWNDEGGRPISVLKPDGPFDQLTSLSNNWALTYDFNKQKAVPGFARIYANYANQGFYGTYKSRVQGFAYQTGWQLDDKQKLVAGVDWERGEVLENRFQDEYQEAGNYSNKSVTNTAIYLQDIFALNDKWTMTPGIRYDHHSKFGGQTTPKVNVNYSADSTTDIYFSYNRVFKAPTLDDLYYDLYYPFYGSTAKGDPNLKPEKGHVISAGVNKKLNEKTSVTANYFTSELTNAIDWDYDDFMNSQVCNIAKQKKRGFELDLKHKLSDRYYTELGYSYVNIKENRDNAGYLVDPKNSQPNGYRVKVGYTDAKWDVNVNGQSASGLDRDYFVDSNYWVWNLAANYKMTPDASVYFNVYNLGDKAYELTSSGSSNRGNYPMTSRHFVMGVKYSF